MTRTVWLSVRGFVYSYSSAGMAAELAGVTLLEYSGTRNSKSVPSSQSSSSVEKTLLKISGAVYSSENRNINRQILAYASLDDTELSVNEQRLSGN